MDEIHLAVYDRVDVVLDILRIRGDDRTVIMIVRLFEFIPLIRNTRIEDAVYPLVDQPLDVPVGKLRRIAFGFAWNRFDSKLIDLPGGGRRQQYTESKRMEECEPEWIILVHIQYAGDADGPSPGF